MDYYNIYGNRNSENAMESNDQHAWEKLILYTVKSLPVFYNKWGDHKKV